jgi:hypothetical protein
MWKAGATSKMSEFNFTNRRDIPSELVKIEDLSTPVQNQLVVRDLDLSSFEFPDHARIWLSAQRHYLYQRFDLGRPSAPSIGTPVRLDSFDAAGLAGVSFRLLVVEPAGKLLGSSKLFSLPTAGRQSTPLLDMRSRDLGQEVWQLELDEETGPLLLVNSRIPDPDTVVNSPMFISCVLPFLVKQIAVWMMTTEIDDNPDTVPGKWLRFFGDLGVELDYDAHRTYQDITVIADDAARQFAAGHRLLDSYVQYAEGPK